MKEEKNCKNCIHYPCYKTQCSFDTKEGCDDFEGIVENAIRIIDENANK